MLYNDLLVLRFQLQDSADAKSSYFDWHLMDVVPRLLDIILTPVQEQMLSRPCGKYHDHGEMAQQESLAEACSKLLARIVAELTRSATETRVEYRVCYLREEKKK